MKDLNNRILKQVEALLPKYYVAMALSIDEDFFPRKIRLHFNKDDYNAMASEIQLFYQFVEERNDQSNPLQIETKKIKTKKWGKQTIPCNLQFNDADQLIAFCQRKRDYRHFTSVLSYLRGQSAFFNKWDINSYMIKQLLHYSLDEWKSIIEIVKFLGNSEYESIYIREMPVATSTKFYENNKMIIKKIFFHMYEKYQNISGLSFEELLNIKKYPSLIRLRFLDKSLKEESNILFDDFALRDIDLERLLAHIYINANFSLVISENKKNYFTMPSLQNAMMIFGEGGAVARLKNIKIPDGVQIYYWGDVDAKGFEILANLRISFPKIKSLFMDWDTWESFKSYSISTGYVGGEVLSGTLTDDELSLYKMVRENKFLLEQEKICANYRDTKLALNFPKKFQYTCL